jgi:hypothetical protein
LYPHEHYEELCAAAATGQASQSELERLKEHLAMCPGCRQLLEGFAQVAAHAIPEVADRHVPTKIPVGMKERFLARAYSEGLFLNKEQPHRAARFGVNTIARWSTVAFSLVLIAVGLKFVSTRHEPSSHLEDPRGQVQTGTPTATGPYPADSKVRQRVESTEAERDALAAKLATAKRALETEQQERGGLGSRLAQLEAAEAELRKAQAEKDRELVQSKEEIDSLRSERDAGRVASLLQENELKDLLNKVTTQRAALDERHQLTAAADQARDLIVARNLHIVDVHDTDENGKGQRAFGRIFYTEAKSLIFYAYDLHDPRQLNAKISFYVWGEKLGAAQSVKNLGIFHSDDLSDGRWVLTFDDPHVLEQINSVFVTVESSKKAVSQPSGKKILYAYLGNKANHP